MAQCSTTHGDFRCVYAAGHPGECECEAPAYDYDSRRELRRAAKRIGQLEKALKTILTAPCDATGGFVVSACPCCMHDRMVARAALDGVE